MVDSGREYRVAELAQAAEVPVRTVRYYQERGLLSPPVRRGRHAFYDVGHLERLTLISDLLTRGHSLEGIADLLASAESGGGVSELLGFESAAATAWADGEIDIDLAQLVDRFGDQITPEIMAEAIALGHVRVEGDRLFYYSGRLLDTATALVAAGIPLRALLALSWELEAGFDRMAFAFVQQFRTHLLGPVLDQPSHAQLQHLSRTLAELRPVVRQAADEHLARAMDRRIRIDLPEISQQLSHAADNIPASSATDNPLKTSES
ncbi:MerR family transcriptional regulator [Nocardia salmonicida]|uniref:MerR family transcriptional regulator n=1 Tax=Nocardia salmonicida TaxID=53431 RepID=UPI0033D5C0DB